MKKFRENIWIIVLSFVLLSLLVIGCFVGAFPTNDSTYTEETQVQATVTYVFKNQQYVPSAHQMLYTVRYDLSVDDTTKTYVQTSYTVIPQTWQLEEGDVVNCTLITTYDNEDNIISKTIK